MSLSPDSLLVLQPFADVFTRPTFCHMRTLVYGTLLASGRRTVTAALRAMGRGDERHFTTYHRVLNRAVWSPLHLSRMLLGLLVMVFLAPDAPLVLLIDGTLERRWGRRIAYKGRFHDAVRSQTGHVVTSEGIHWLSLMLLVSVPWCRRQWALPVISVPTLTEADQHQTWQTASHDDTGCTASHLARETLVSRARDRVGGRRRFCRDQPGSYLSSLASSFHLPIIVDRTTLRSCPAATQGQARSQAQERFPPAEVD